MEELKRQLIEAVAAIDVHDEETSRLLMRGAVLSADDWSRRNDQRAALVLAVAGVARSMVALWKAEASSATPCGAEFAGHVCSTKGAHVMHEDERTVQRWPVTP
jgi:hypothetical protein